MHRKKGHVNKKLLHANETIQKRIHYLHTQTIQQKTFGCPLQEWNITINYI